MKAEDLEFFETLVGGQEKLEEGFGRQYNMFAMEEGIKIAEALQTKEAIVNFSKSDWDDQKTLVPTIDDGHSGNTFGLACRFAISYLPQLLINKRDSRIDSVIN